MKAPIARVSLPTHHAAVAGCKEGQCVTMVARKMASDRLEPMMAGEKSGPRPPPVNTDFNVESIEPMKGMSKAEKAEERAEGRDAMSAAKSKNQGKAKIY